MGGGDLNAMKTMVAWIVVLALLAGSGTAFAQGAPVEKKMFNQTLGLVGLAAILTGAILMVPMEDPNSTTYNLPDDSFCVTTNTTRQRVDVTEGGCRASEPMITAGLITMGIGGALTLIGFHKVTVSPQVGHKVVGAKLSVKW